MNLLSSLISMNGVQNPCIGDRAGTRLSVQAGEAASPSRDRILVLTMMAR
jgi:hypothetical protein